VSGSGSRAALATLVSLEGMGPARLRAVLAGRTPSEALEAVLALRPPEPSPPDRPAPRISDDLLRRWQRQARTADPSDLLAAYGRGGFEVVMYGERGYPQQLLVDPDPPLVLSIDGDLQRIAMRAVAIVGTRRCTRAGYDTAYRLGRDLSVAGVSVVSGLAAGIDAAAHRGAVDAHGASPLAVVGTGLDVPYPRSNAPLWRAVAAAGTLVSEAPLGARPDRWRFPSRNRIIAGLADLVVVVESPERGGSMHTVDEADARSVDVLTVPGPVQARTSAGTNALLFEGRGAVRDAADVLLALGSVPPAATLEGSRAASRPEPDARVLDAFEWQPATVDLLAVRTGLDPFEVCSVLDGLVASRVVVERAGWYERSDEVVRGLER
jgi:DNA processing protein